MKKIDLFKVIVTLGFLLYFCSCYHDPKEDAQETLEKMKIFTSEAVIAAHDNQLSDNEIEEMADTYNGMMELMNRNMKDTISFNTYRHEAKRLAKQKLNLEASKNFMEAYNRLAKIKGFDKLSKEIKN